MPNSKTSEPQDATLEDGIKNKESQSEYTEVSNVIVDDFIRAKDNALNCEDVADEDYTYTNENSKSPPPTGNNNKEEYDDGDILSSKTSEPHDKIDQ